MLTKNDLEQIANFILLKSTDCHFVLTTYDNKGNVKQFGHGCQRCAADVLFAVATKLAQKPHNSEISSHTGIDNDQPIH